MNCLFLDLLKKQFVFTLNSTENASIQLYAILHDISEITLPVNYFDWEKYKTWIPIHKIIRFYLPNTFTQLLSNYYFEILLDKSKQDTQRDTWIHEKLEGWFFYFISRIGIGQLCSKSL